MKEIIDRLHGKLENLISKLNDLESQNLILSKKLSDNTLTIKQKEESIEDLKEKNRILKISSSLNNVDGNDKSSKKQINDLVREIDKCIALLNK
jgi:chromosome segregation ATPase